MATRRMRLLFHYLGQHKAEYLLAALATLGTNWIAVTLPHYIKLSVDLITSGGADFSRLRRYLAVMAALAAGMAAARIFSRFLFYNAAREIERRMKGDLLEKLLSLDKNYYDRNSSGAVISRINNDITGVRLLCGFGVFQVVNLLSSFSLAPAQMWRLSPRLTLWAAFAAAVVFAVYRTGMEHVRILSRRQMAHMRDLSAFSASSLSAVEVIKNFSMARWARRKFKTHNLGWLTTGLKMSVWNCFLGPLLGSLESLLKILVLALGARMVLRGEFSVGDLTAYLAYIALIMAPLMGLNWMTNMLQQGILGLESIETILSEKPPARAPRFERGGSSQCRSEGAPARAAAIAAPAKPEPGLEVRDLHYAYPGADGEILRGVSFKAPPGKVVGILGRIGAGKTTLVNCLNGYLDPGPGRIFVDGEDAAVMDLAKLRSKIRTVTQEPFLFSETVRDNVEFLSGAHLGDDELWRIFRECALENEVRHFPQQEKTLVGEKGIMLSGGQKQRMALARALLAPCSLLILDNMLSAVDYETERRLLETIYQKRHIQSLLLVSHRVKALEKADLILVLEDGKIADQGTHEELLRRGGFYRDTWLLQNAAPEREEEFPKEATAEPAEPGVPGGAEET
ncbi:MAG TPA: ABC transporter ATP-binding protein [Verrucomicrobiae bacterium]|nr:ABC transporter ATP-binding protein [Verrucomicrobiae bacterium]